MIPILCVCTSTMKKKDIIIILRTMLSSVSFSRTHTTLFCSPTRLIIFAITEMLNIEHTKYLVARTTFRIWHTKEKPLATTTKTASELTSSEMKHHIRLVKLLVRSAQIGESNIKTYDFNCQDKTHKKIIVKLINGILYIPPFTL